MTRAEIEGKIAVLQEAHGGNVFNVDWEKIGPSSGLEEGKWERQSEVGISPATDDQGTIKTTCDNMKSSTIGRTSVTPF